MMNKILALVTSAAICLMAFGNQLIAQVSKTNSTPLTVSSGPSSGSRNFTFTSGDFGGCTSLTEVEISITLDMGSGAFDCNAAGDPYSVQEDLALRLTSPSGTSVDLVYDKWDYFEESLGNTLSQFITVPTHTILFDDDAASVISGDWNSWTTARPVEPLSGFDGENAEGVWTLSMADGHSQFSASDYFCMSTTTLTITCGAAPTPCDPPTSPLVSNITDTAAVLSWTGGVTGADRYQMRWREVGTGPWYARNTFGEIGSRHVKAFEPATEYEWIIRTRCGAGDGDSSDWVTGPNFTTLAGCGPVQDVTISNITETQVDASWPSHAGATEYLLRFKPTSGSEWRSRRVNGATTSTTLGNLTPGTEYEYRLRVYCETGLSRRGDLANFTTPGTPPARLADPNDAESLLEIALYPNPTQGEITVEFGDVVESATVDVMNTLGQTVFSKSVSGSDRAQFAMDVEPGVYIVSVTIGTVRKMTKLVVE